MKLQFVLWLLVFSVFPVSVFAYGEGIHEYYNELENGDFNYVPGTWDFWSADPEASQFGIDCRLIFCWGEVSHTKLQAQPWMVQVRQDGIQLRAKVRYHVSVDAYASTDDGKISLAIIDPNYENLGFYQEIPLTTSRQTYGFEFVPAEHNGAARFVIECGHSLDTIYIHEAWLIPYVDDVGVKLWMPSNEFQAGMPCSLWSLTYNSGADLEDHYWICVIDAWGQLFYHPDWGRDGNYRRTTVYSGAGKTPLITDFVWPGGISRGSGIVVWGAILDPDFSLIGEMSSWSFGWK